MSFLAQTNNILVQKLRLVNDFPLLFPQTQIPPFLIILAEIEHSKGLRINDRNKTRLKLKQNTARPRDTRILVPEKNRAAQNRAS